MKTLTVFHFSWLVLHSDSEQYEGSRFSPHPGNSNSLPAYSAGPYSGQGITRDSSLLPLYYSGGGKNTPQTLALTPTTLAMLQQHNYIPYFRGTRLSLPVSCVVCSLKPTNATACMGSYVLSLLNTNECQIPLHCLFKHTHTQRGTAQTTTLSFAHLP